METRLVDFDYAPDITKLRMDQILCVVVTPVCLDISTGIHRLAAIPSGAHCRFKGSLDTGMASYSLLRVQVIDNSSIPLLAAVEQSLVFGHQHATWDDAQTVVELCAGMGALGQGAMSVGFRPFAACEFRERIAGLYTQCCDATMIVGDICDFKTVEELYRAHPRSSVLAAGISCQPYSRLGDCKSGSDKRAQTLPATLSCAHYLRSLVVILECVEPAGKDAFVNWHINQFCIRTGFHRTEAILQLSDVWPCKRNRWWCILSAPAIGPVQLPPLPQMFDLPSIRHVLPEIQQWDLQEERQLRLTPVELEAFSQESGSVTKYLPNMKGILPCALHAWGSQVLPCPCGCRSEGLSPARLQSRGLYGVIAPCVALAQSAVDKTQSLYRHLHPRETALLCGLDPVLTWSNDLRLTLGAVGQLASPIHANWVFNHVKHALQSAHLGISKVQPIAELRAYRSWLLARARMVWTFNEDELVPSEALDLSFKWKSHANLPVSEAITVEGSMDEALKKLSEHCHQAVFSESGSVSDLTATQIAIPSQEDREVQSPTSEVASVESHGRFSLRLVVSTGDPLGDFDTQIFVQGPACVKDVVQAEKSFANWSDQEIQCWSEGIVVDENEPLVPGMTLYITFLGVSIAQSVSEDDKADINMPPAVPQHPLTSIKGNAFLHMLPPQVSTVCQAESLRKQTISRQDRIAICNNQGSIWGDDEVLWHLEQMCHRLPHDYHDSFGKLVVLGPLLASGWLHGSNFHDLKMWFEAQSCPRGIITAFIDQGHWTPLVLSCEEHIILAFAGGTDDREKEAVRNLVQKFAFALSREKTDFTFEKPSYEHQCCGAYVIAFVAHMLTSRPLPKTCDELMQFHDHSRTLFTTTLQKNLCQNLCLHPWTWGAGKETANTAVDKLVPFLRERGVDPDRVQTRAQSAVKAIGAAEVLKAIDSANPWKSLKTLATNVKFQLVLHDELQQHIAGKAGQEVGKGPKKARANRVPKQPDPIVLDPSKLQVPNGTFSSGGEDLQQLAPSQIGPLAKGVVVVTSSEAEPFLKANQLVSGEPLALLVLNAPSTRWSTTLACTRVTVPARCVMNQEPLLLEASLIQIGKGIVEKQIGSSKLAIDTVKVSTLKVIVYKDEVQIAWEAFVAGPVKYIVSQVPLLKLCQERDCKCQCWRNTEEEQVSAAIVDVWRRQYLRQGFKPENPSSATIFTVCIRVPSCLQDRIIEVAGHGGVYVEPRTLDAREIDRSFDVVWIPRADKSSVTHLRQTNPMVAGITRLGEGWGLRVKSEQAHLVHQVVRPDAVFLEQGPRLQYNVSPIPFGTDRQALSRALKNSGWEVKPIQPVGSVEGGRGNTWNVVATKPPPSNIISMSHGDVVISTIKSVDKSKSDQMKPVAASSTLNLCGANRVQHPSGTKDPWVLQDPWQAYQGPRPEAVTRGATDASESLKQLEQRIEMAVLSKVPQQPTSMEQDDVPDRVLVLEKQVNTLMSKQQQMEVNIQDHHAHHTAQLSQLQGQLNAQGQQVAIQLESQQQNIKSMFDSQMAQIRGLLSKRPREDGE